MLANNIRPNQALGLLSQGFNSSLLSDICASEVHGDRERPHDQSQAGKLQTTQNKWQSSMHARKRSWWSERNCFSWFGKICCGKGGYYGLSDWSFHHQAFSGYEVHGN